MIGVFLTLPERRRQTYVGNTLGCKHFDVIEDICAGILLGYANLAASPLALEQLEEPLC